MEARHITEAADPILGIDLGTTKSVVGIWRAGEPHIIPDRFGYRSIPSLVLVTPNEDIFAGREAQKHPDRYKSKNVTISSVKRLMGRKGETGWGWWKTYPQEVSAFILAELKNQAERHLGHEVKRAVIAIPSHFDESQRRATKEAAEIAGLEVSRLLNEATAAVLTYGLNKQDRSRVLVLNFGGGTVDISIVDFGEGFYQVLSVEGDSKLGGDDLDQVIIDYILEDIRRKYGAAMEFDPPQKLILKEAAEKAKINLSSMLSTSIHIPGFIKTKQSYHDLDVTIDRRTFEQLSKSLLDRVIPLVRKALESVRWRPSDLGAVLLLGGSSRIPIFRESIRKFLGINPVTGVDPEICVAQGAIVQAAILEGNLRDALLSDVLPGSYGVGLADGKFSKLIEKNYAVPTRSYPQRFTTSRDLQPTIQIEIYQGESEKASENTFLSTLELTGIPPCPRGLPQIEVTFDVDADMIVHVSARDLGTGKEQKIEVKSPYGLSGAQIRLMQYRLKSWLCKKRIVELKSDIEPLCYSIETLLSYGCPDLDWEDISALKSREKFLKELMAKKASYEDLQKAISFTQSLRDKAQHKVAQYEALKREIHELTLKMEKLAPILKPRDEKEALLLSQGRDLLQEYLRLGLTYAELHKMLSSVHTAYEKAKVDLIEDALEDLAALKQTTMWTELETSMSNSALTAQALSKLGATKETILIVTLLTMEDSEHRKSIQQSVLEKLYVKPFHRALFILIVSAFVDPLAISATEEYPRNEPAVPLVALALFNVLDTKETADHRSKAAKLIASHLPEIQYISMVVDRTSKEVDAIVKRYLTHYLDRQPTGAFYEFFLKTDSSTRTKIVNSRDMLVKLAKEPNEDICLYAIESLANFPSDEVIPLVLPFVHGENSKVRTKTLELFIKFRTHDPRVVEVFAQALHNPAPEMQLLALKFVEIAGETSYLSDVFALLQSEPGENVQEGALAILSNMREIRAIPHLLKSLMGSNQKIRGLALSGLERNKELMDKEIMRLFGLIRKATLEKHSLGIRDKIFLRSLSGKRPDMKDIIQALVEIDARKRLKSE
jgi:molecular chaperone DnaK